MENELDKTRALVERLTDIIRTDDKKEQKIQAKAVQQYIQNEIKMMKTEERLTRVERTYQSALKEVDAKFNLRNMNLCGARAEMRHFKGSLEKMM